MFPPLGFRRDAGGFHSHSSSEQCLGGPLCYDFLVRLIYERIYYELLATPAEGAENYLAG